MLNNTNFRSKLRRLMAFLLICLPTPMVWGDVTIVIDHRQGEQHVQSRPMQISKGKIKMTIDALDDGYVLFDASARTIAHVNDKEQSYTLIDEKTFEALSSTINQLQKNMMAQLERLPPERRKQMEAILAQTSSPPASEKGTDAQVAGVFRSTGHKRAVSGYECEVMEKYQGDVKVAEMCVAEVVQTTMPTEDFETIKAFYEFMKQMATRMPGGEKIMAEIGFWELKQNIIPLQITRFQNEALKSMHTITQIKTTPLSAEIFIIPASYKKRQDTPKL